MGFFDSLQLVYNSGHNYQSNSDMAHIRTECPDCGSGTMMALAKGGTPEHHLAADASVWLMCLSCGCGAFALASMGDGILEQYPQALPFSTPENLSADVSSTWEEARRSYAANAYTGCTLMCRKIVFHMAVEAGLSASNEKGFAPNFTQCIDHLVKEGWITNRHKQQWVDSIREWGNQATHELESIDAKTAYKALEFTFQLLQMGYSFPASSPDLEK